MTPVLLERTGLVEGEILRRYKRFLADVRMPDGSVAAVHCTNTGSMRTCWEPGDRVLVAPTANPNRKLRYTWVACERGPGVWVGVETGIPNRVVAEAARRDALPGLPGLREVRTEVPYGREHSRIDVLVRDAAGLEVFIEVKNATLRDGARVLFPDAATARGTKHLRELQAVMQEGKRAAAVFFVHRPDVSAFAAAREVDPRYAEELDRAAAAGLEVLPLAVRLVTTRDADGSWRATWELPGLLPWEPGR